MKFLQAAMGWFFTWLGFGFMGLSILVVPQNAFADYMTDCSDACCTACFGTETCDPMSSCHMSCNGDCQLCAANCKDEGTCIQDCLNQTKKCASDAKFCQTLNDPTICRGNADTCLMGECKCYQGSTLCNCVPQ
jgi:hypothetical protein